MIPFVDLNKAYGSLKEATVEAVSRVIEGGNFILGPELESFEAEFADFTGARFAVGVSSGTEALHLALRAAGIGEGDQVITVSFTFAATVIAIRASGATPVFVDVDPDTLNMDTSRLEERITPLTKAIMPVHLYGRPADMAAITAIAEKHGLAVIEDAAQAHGARYKGEDGCARSSELHGAHIAREHDGASSSELHGAHIAREHDGASSSAAQGAYRKGEDSASSVQRVGSYGLAGCFSFYPSKNLGACGDGGMVTTSDAGLAERLKALRHVGQTRKNFHEIIGFNSRLHEIQAAILRLRLPHLDRLNHQRMEAAAIYDMQLCHLAQRGFIILPDQPESASGQPPVRDPDTHVFHIYGIRIPELPEGASVANNGRSGSGGASVANNGRSGSGGASVANNGRSGSGGAGSSVRNRLQNFLNSRGICTGIHYPVPVHLQPAQLDLNYQSDEMRALLSNSEAAADSELSLPMYPGISPEYISQVTSAIEEFFGDV